MAHSGFFDFTQREFGSHQENDVKTVPSHHRHHGHVIVQKSKTGHQTDTLAPVLSRRKQYVFFKEHDNLGEEIAKELNARFLTQSPDAIVSFVSGHDHFHTWKREDFRSALQAGIVKLLGSLDLLLIDDGLNYGLTRLIGAAIRSEEEYRNCATGYLSVGSRKPSINYFGFVPFSKVAYPERFSTLHESDHGGTFEIESKPPGAGEGFDLSRYHSHYILVDKSYGDMGFIRLDVEKQLQSCLTTQLVRPSDADGEQRTKTIFVPHVVFFFQGGLDELDRIHMYLTRRTPVIIMDGCGGMADVVAACLKLSSETDTCRLQAAVTACLVSAFSDLEGSPDMLRKYADTLLQIVRQAVPPGKLCYIADCRRLETFDTLDVPLLRAMIDSSAEQRPTSGQYVRNFLHCLACNRSEVVTTYLLNTFPWSQIREKWTLQEFTYPGMVRAVMVPDREAFVEILLEQRFPLRYLTSYLDLLHFFQTAADKECFLSVVWEDILGHKHTEPIEEDFVLKELNPLIQRMTKIRNYIDMYELSRVALLRDDTGIDPRIADNQSLRALVVFAVLLNRVKLVRLLLRYSLDPVAHIIFVETMYRAMYRAASNSELRIGLKQHTQEFGRMAEDIVDAGIRETPHRARLFFQRRIVALNNKTMLEMAYDARNRTFISNPHVQNWLSDFGRGFIRVKGSHPNLKLVLSAYFFVPMYFWLSFPRHVPHRKRVSVAVDLIYAYEPETPEHGRAMLDDLKQSFPRISKVRSQLRHEETLPTFPSMVYAVWSAPVVKFWTWFLIYLAFLIVIGVDMMMPACTNIGMDIAVFVLTSSMWLELSLRTICDLLLPTKIDFAYRSADLMLQTVFNTLFFLFRLFPYRYEHPFAGRVILAFGVMYYYYSVWHKFYLFIRQIGPFTRICMIIYRLDLPRWLVIVLPFFVSTAVIWQSLMTPDFPFSGEEWRRALFQGMWTVFGVIYPALEYNTECEASKLVNWTNFTQPAGAHPPDRCWLGDYTDYTCNTVSFWAYFFEIQYYFFLKLGMMIIMVAMYTGRMGQEMGKANLIWRYNRFQLLLEYYWRSSLPFPLNIFGNIYLIYKYSTKNGVTLANMDPEVAPIDVKTSFYWKSTAAAYFARKDKEEAAVALAMKQEVMISKMKGSIQSTIKQFDDLEFKSSGPIRTLPAPLEAVAQQTPDALLTMRSGVRSQVAAVFDPEPHKRSRGSPYPGTSVNRITVCDKDVSWTVKGDDYEPASYSKPLESFEEEEQPFVDHVQASNSGSEEQLRSVTARTSNTRWNSVRCNIGKVVYRKTWICDEDGEPLRYRVSSNGLPLNPKGRTGLGGRGSLYRYGPNHRLILAVTAMSGYRTHFIVSTSTGILPNIPFRSYESEYSAVTNLLRTILFGPASCRDMPPIHSTEIQTKAELTEFLSLEISKKLTAQRKPKKEFPGVRLRVVYRGYLDSPMNTDNAWLEAFVLHVAVPHFALGFDSAYRWQSYPALDGELPDLDTAILGCLTF